MAAKKKLSFEERLAQVEALIGEMESGALPLEDALRRYEEGMNALAALEKDYEEVGVDSVEAEAEEGEEY